MEMDVQERFERIERNLERTGQEIDKQNDGIRGLIVVARTCLDSIKEMGERHEAEIKELREAQAATDEKLNILIEHEAVLDQMQTRTDAQIQELRQAQAETGEKLKALIETVDRIIRNRNGKE